MAKKKQSAPARIASGQVSLSYATITIIVVVIGAVLGLGRALWSMAAEIATKSDVALISAQIAPKLDGHEARIRELELQMARQFGASPAGARVAPASGEFYPNMNMILAQYTTQALPTRRVVVPFEMIKQFQMEPSRGGVLVVMGEDGKAYSLDDVLAIIIRLHFAERNLRK